MVVTLVFNSKVFISAKGDFSRSCVRFRPLSNVGDDFRRRFTRLTSFAFWSPFALIIMHVAGRVLCGSHRL